MKRTVSKAQLTLVTSEPRVPTSRELAEQARNAFRSEARALLIRDATEIMREILRERGRVTSTDVRARMVERGLIHRERAFGLDPRWIGAVFIGAGLVRVGWEATGTHGRPVAIWMDGGVRD